MDWKLFYHPRAVKQLKRLHQKDQKKVIDNLKKLEINSEDKSLNLTALAGTKRSFRMRTGKVRLIFEKDNKKKIIYIWRIKYRKDIYRV
jgi:mRNA-degrading endonuclease RelE of RelBE toxin-antitoxin system